MRKRYRVLLLAAIVAAVVVPVGFALSLESSASADVSSAATVAAANPSAPVLVRKPPAMAGASVPESAKLLAVGTVLFGVAAAVRHSA